MRRALGVVWGAPVMIAWMAVAGCDEPFQPLQESDRNLSIFGALDAATDTQWVRVMPVRPTVLTTSDPLGVTVTLEHSATGRIVELRDSLVQFFGRNVQDAISLFTHNFWTTEPIEPGETYSFRVAKPDGGSAGATVPIPGEYPVSVTYSAFDGAIADVRVTEIDYLGLVLFRHHVPLDCVDWPGPPFYLGVAFPVGLPNSGVFRVRVSSFLDPRIQLPCEIVKTDLFVVASGSPWPADLEYDPAALGVLTAPQNVENGVGFLGGILSKPIPWEPCTVEPPSGSGCELTYDPTSATLAGTVTDAATGNPILGAELRLTEIGADPTPPTRNRGSTDREGSYEIGAVPVAVEQVFRVSHPSHCTPDPLSPFAFLDHVDTLTALTPAARTTLDVALERNPACVGVQLSGSTRKPSSRAASASRSSKVTISAPLPGPAQTRAAAR